MEKRRNTQTVKLGAGRVNFWGEDGLVRSQMPKREKGVNRGDYKRPLLGCEAISFGGNGSNVPMNSNGTQYYQMELNIIKWDFIFTNGTSIIYWCRANRRNDVEESIHAQ